MTRCSYIPPEGQSASAIAKERGGATDGDIQALVDRFGCKAEATRIIGRAGSTIIDAHACDDHVGHLLGDAPCAWVEPVGSAPPPGWDEAPEVPLHAIEDLVAAEISSGHARDRIEADRLLYGTGFGRLRPDGTLEHIPTPEMVVDRREAPPSGWGESILQRAQRTATCDVARGIHVLGADAASATACQCGRPFDVAFEPMPLSTPQTVGVARPEPSRNTAGAIIDREFCDRVNGHLATAWGCRRCGKATRMETTGGALIQPLRCCGAQAEQIRLADLGVYTEP